MILFQRAAFALSRLSAALAALVILYMVLHILLEIVLRSVFGTSTFVLDEMIGYAIASATFLSLGYAFEHGSLVRVGALIDHLRGRMRRAANALCAAAMLAIMGLVTWNLASTALRSLARGRRSSSIIEIPLWIPEALCTFGLAVFCIQIFAYLLRQLTDTPAPVRLGGDSQNDL